LRDARDCGEFLEARAFVVAAKGALGKEIHREQDAREEGKKGERRFPE
jgi:hypothetical protein